MRPHSEKKFFVLGNNILDHVYRVRSWERDSKATALGYRTFPGGQAANVAWTLAACGERTAFCGRFGKDQDGLTTADSLKAVGVDLSSSLFAEHGRTARAVILVDEAKNDRTIIMHFDAELLAQPLNSLPDLRDTDCLYWDGYESTTAVELLDSCKRYGVLTCGNIEAIDQLTIACLDKLDVLIMPRAIYCAVFGADAFTQLLAGRAPVGWEGRTLVVTAGSDGSFCLRENSLIHAAAEPAKVVDSTGAGDAFSAGLIAGLARGDDINAGLKFAARLGALACETEGPRASIGGVRHLLASR